MDTPLVIALVVSGIGMLLLFVALALLCGFMYVMTWVTSIRLSAVDQSDGPGDEKAKDKKRRVALIAVSLARAEQELAGTPKTGETSTPWRALHHQRQLTLNRFTRRIR
jgi:hypothetical protein